jgi:N-acetylglucosamine malate deacetylase 1
MTGFAHVLAFGAHPDDVELTVGGTVLLLRARGYDVVIVDATRGELGTRGTPEIRAAEAQEAARRLGVSQRINLGLPDGHLRATDEARRKAVEVIRRFKPVVLLAPRPDDLHPDHAHLSVLVREAAFLSGVARFGEGPPHRARAVLQYASHTTFVPSFVVDVSAYFDAKKHAALAYRSQFFDPASKEPATYLSSSGFWAWWEARARHFGHLVGATHGEPFLVDGPLLVTDPVAQFADFGYYPKSNAPAKGPAAP